MRTSSQLDTSLPPMLTIRSPASTPAAAAGVPGSTFSSVVLTIALALVERHDEEEQEGHDHVHDHAGDDEGDLVPERVGVVPPLERSRRDLVGAQRPWSRQPVLRVLGRLRFFARLVLFRLPLRLFLPGFG